MKTEILPILNNILNSLNSKYDFDECIQIIYNGCRKLITFDYYIILLKRDKENDFFLFKCEPKKAFDLNKQYAKKNNKFVEYIEKNKKSLLSDDITQDGGDEFIYFTIEKFEKSFIGSPLLINNEVKGIVVLLSEQVKAFTEHDQLILENFAGIIAKSILNSEHFEYSNIFDVAIVGEILAEFGHDIRTCSSLISGEATLIQGLYKKNTLTVNKAIEAVRKIETHAGRIERLTEDIAKRSKQVPINFEKSNLAGIIKETINLTYKRVEYFNIAINVDYESLNFYAEIDVKRIKLVLINIFVNAFEAMPNGGNLIIKAQKHEEFYELIFIDSGKGISKKNIDIIWDPFFTTKTSGLGLGLSICKRIIESEHKGNISIKSEERQGTTVIIKLPLQQNYK